MKIFQRCTAVGLLFVAVVIGVGCAAERDTAANLPQTTGWPSTFLTSQGLRMVLIPGGTFQMGPVTPAEEDQGPQRQVTLSPFYLSAFEVSKGYFRAFAEEAGIVGRFPELDPTAVDRDRDWAYKRAPGEAYPVYEIDWHTAVDYAAWLSKREGRLYRLPTEAEWEYACRAGTETLRWWGDERRRGMAVTRGSSFDQTPYAGYFLPGTTPANPWGLYEILGNAAEWTQDWYDPYPASSQADPRGPRRGDTKVVRGGSIGWVDEIVTSFYRAPFDPRRPLAGIRLVCEPNRGPAPAPIVRSDTLPSPMPPPPATLHSIPLGEGVTLDLVRLPAGTYRMGSPAEEFGHGQLEAPLTTVTLSYAFSIGRHEVTQRQYALVTGTNPSRWQDLDRPVEQVTFNEAVAYCATLTTRERAAGRLGDDEVYRLPTEPEWEYACRTGTTTAYFHGDDASQLDGYAWHDRTDGTRQVGTRLPNPWGLHDMHGNVQEWCWGAPFPHPGGEQIDPRRRPGLQYQTQSSIWSVYGPYRTARGGGWCFAAVACRSAMRQGFDWKGRFDFVGFRIVRAPTSVDVSQVPSR